MNWRLKALSVTFILGFLLIALKLFYWQIIKGPLLASKAREQQTSGTSVIAPRGNILSSDNSPLVASTNSWLAYAYLPDIINSPENIAKSLAPFFVDLDLEEIRSKKKELSENKEEETEEINEKKLITDEVKRLEKLLSNTNTTWVPLKKRINSSIKNNIEALHISGIGFDKKIARFYPEGSMSAHILGFMGKDDEGQNKGYFGLEGYYDLTLKGKKGFLEREASALGIPILIGRSKISSAKKGVDLVTHIDKFVQLKVENKLEKALETYGAKKGTIIVINPQNGGVIAMASLPSYEPKRYYEYTNEIFRNPAISDSFEPGSIFKPVIMAAALDAGVVDPDTKCDICDKPLKVDKYYIKTWNDEYESNRTMTDVIVHSDNVGMAFVGSKLGAKKLYNYLNEFGFGELTQIDLQGEMTPALRKKSDWSYVDVATVSFGQGIAITPIQMINAIVTIARGGTPITPQVVDKLRLEDWEKDIKPREGKRVISQKAAEEITKMMVAAAEKGEAQWTTLRNFKIAGKTGTAQIPVQGYYDEEKTIASFVGFAPADNPRFVMLVTLQEPQSSPWASETAAPLWFSIAKDLLSHFSIQPVN